MCEEHPDLPFGHQTGAASKCPGPGIPCDCNPRELMPPDVDVVLSVTD
jgi:hypothetical protein